MPAPKRQHAAPSACSPWSGIYTSPLSRCARTAATLADPCTLALRLLDTFADVDHGTWQRKASNNKQPALAGRFIRGGSAEPVAN
ncbi:MAG: histidine phosphatase family protein [Acetobacteraceae bacterium]